MCTTCTQYPQNISFSTQITLLLSNCTIAIHNFKSDPLQLKWPSIYSKMHKCTQPTPITPQMHQICIQIIRTLISTLLTSKCAFAHLPCSNLQTSKLSSTSRCSKRAPMHLQCEAPQWLFQTLKPLKIHSLTNKIHDSNSRSCVNGPITYWSIIKLEIKVHKQIHIDG
jgi:hypothetical protein